MITQKPLKVFLVNTHGAILVDSIFCGTGSPSATIQLHQPVRIKSYNGRTMQPNGNAIIIFDFGVCIITNLPLFTISLTMHHRNRFGVGHCIFLRLQSLNLIQNIRNVRKITPTNNIIRDGRIICNLSVAVKHSNLKKTLFGPIGSKVTNHTSPIPIIKLIDFLVIHFLLQREQPNHTQ